MPDHRLAMTEPLRFGVFEIDPSARELRKHGVRIKLQDQPFAVLLILLEKPGQLVTKEELQQRLWPADTFVEFDKGIYNAMKRLRETLGDEADTPRYIETLPRRGYRFIAPVQGRDGGGKPPELSLAPEPTPRLTATKRLALLVSLLCVLPLAAIFIRVKLWSTPPVPKVVDTAQVTKDGVHKDVTLKLISDDTRLYFQEGSWMRGFTEGVSLVQVSTEGGETARIPVALEGLMVYDISRTRSELLVGAGAAKMPNNRRPLWVVPLPTGPPRRVGDILAQDASWAPDGRYLVFALERDVFVARPDGTEVRKIAATKGFVSWLRFSPDGTRLRFSVSTTDHAPTDWDIMEMSPNGGGLHSLPVRGIGGTWSADGKYYYYSGGPGYRDVWVLPERRTILGKVELGAPEQLTAGPIAFGGPTPTTDGRHLFVSGEQHSVELVRYDSRSKQFVPFLGGISAGELEVSPDGQWVVYTTFPECNLWRSKLDGSERLQLTFPPMNAHEPRWSPDGKQILFTDFPSKIFVVPADGGAPKQLMPADHPELIGAGAWLPDGNSIVFGRRMGCAADDLRCWLQNLAIYVLSLKTQQVSKIPGSDALVGARLSRDGRYIAAVTTRLDKVMLYDFHTQRWSELVQGDGSITWSHDSKFVYLRLKQGTEPAKLVRVRVPDGKIEQVADLKDITLGGSWADWVSLLPDDSPLLMLDKNAQEIYRFDLEYR